MADGNSYELLVAKNLVREDVTNQIADLSLIRKPLMSRIGRSTHGNEKFETPQDKLQSPDTTNAVVETYAGTNHDENYLPTWSRVANFTQISTKELSFTRKQLNSDDIALQGQVSRQTSRRMEELTRDMEAIALSGQASAAESGSSAGTTAGLQTHVADESISAASAGTPDIYDATDGNPSQYRIQAASGFTISGWPNNTSGEMGAVAYSSVTAAALTEVAMLDVVEQLHNNGFAESTMFTGMTRPSLVRRISAYSFTSSARIATLVNQGTDNSGKRTASGSVQYWQTDFGVLELVSNRLMQLEDSGESDSTTLLIFDPAYVSLSMMAPFQTKRDQAASLIDKYMISAHWGVRVTNYEAIGAVFCIDATAAMTAS